MSSEGVAVGKRAVRGGLIFTAASYAALIFGIVARKVLAIFLNPIDFGYVNAAVSLVTLVLSFGSFSFSSAIINVRDNLVEEPLEYLKENVFILTFATGAFLSIVAIVIAFLLPEHKSTTVIAAMVSAYAVQRFVAAFDTFYAQILERTIDYVKISRVTLIANLLLHGCSIALALAGVGAWSIPIATLLSTIVSAAAHRHYVQKAGLDDFAENSWKHYRPKTAKWLWRFGTRVLFNRLFEAWLFQVDNILVLSFWGATILGYYGQAFTIAQMPAIALAPIVARVSIAAYAEIQHDRNRLTEAFAFTNYFLVRLLVASTVFVVLTSADLVRVFLSTKWLYSAAPLEAMFGFVLTISLFENAKMLLGARLKLREISIVRASQLALLAVLILTFGISGGIVAVALSVSVVSMLGYIFLLYFVHREVDIRWRETFVLPLLTGALTLALLKFLIDRHLSEYLAPGRSISESVMRMLIYGTISVVSVAGLEFAITPGLLRSRINGLRVRFAR